MSALRLAPDHLRPPTPLDPSAPAYKDWLHLNLFDHATGAVGIVNVSLDGAPDDPAARAVGTALVEMPGEGWLGNLSVRPFVDARLAMDSIALDAVAIRVDAPRGLVSVSARLPADRLRIDVTGEARTVAMVPDRTVPFGSGWLGWYAVPRLAMTGEIRVGDVAVPMTQASGYVDHSWGRWHWGEDIGWEWGSFLTCAPGPALVLSRVTDRLHTRASGTAIELRLGARRRAFHEHTVEVSWSGQLVADPRRLPGSLAVLHADRARPRLPATLRLRADDGRDSVQLEFTGRAVAQLILADTTERGYSFLHEIVGSFTCSGRIGGVTFADDGLAVVERVE